MSKSIKDILPYIIGPQTNWKIRLLDNWSTIWGNLSSKVHLERIEQHQLIIGVHDSCWLHELHMLSHLLLRTINKVLGSEQIKRLRFKKVEKKNTSKQSHTKNRPVKTAHHPVILSQRERSALKLIKDPHLSHALEQFLIRCYQEK